MLAQTKATKIAGLSCRLNLPQFTRDFTRAKLYEYIVSLHFLNARC